MNGIVLVVLQMLMTLIALLVVVVGVVDGGTGISDGDVYNAGGIDGDDIVGPGGEACDDEKGRFAVVSGELGCSCVADVNGYSNSVVGVDGGDGVARGVNFDNEVDDSSEDYFDRYGGRNYRSATCCGGCRSVEI